MPRQCGTIELTGFADLMLSTRPHCFDATLVDDDGPDVIDTQTEWSDAAA
ncbi:MAG: hypothetical protein MK323_02935 [Gammaproteobacteria bacterium]|jgi:hypothetical protein|nr:hypothetical protein [Gammaproteobacteria bacterium]